MTSQETQHVPGAARAYVLSVEGPDAYEGNDETVVGVFGSENAARAHAEADDAVDYCDHKHPLLNLGGNQHIRLYCGAVCEVHIERSREIERTKDREGRMVSSKQTKKWLEWRTVS